MLREYRPMLATLIDKPFNDKGWVFETKWDGFRMISEIKKRKVTLYSRNGKNVTARYPAVARALAKIKTKIKSSAVIDGELIALDRAGRSRFQLLQNALNTKARLVYCVFDILFLDGKDLRKRPLLERKAALSGIVPKTPLIRYSTHRPEHGVALFKQAKKQKLEGIMAKRAAGLYYSGVRKREWLKIKTSHGQEVVIVGYTTPRRSRKYFGALVLAVREGNPPAGGWRYVGRAGTGFDAAALKTIHAKLVPLITNKKPVGEKVPDEVHTTWVRPVLVGEVKFTEWTRGGEIRHPAFVGLREDKPAMQVVREREKML
jgi:bifunctional non-homologous end joining protein LigD